jgi:hypothetical protein
MLRNLRRIGLVFALLFSGLIGAATLGAAPAFAGTYPCLDDTNIASVNVWPTPADTGSTMGSLPSKGKEVNGPGCNWYNNAGEGMWYMQISYESSIGYVWVQRLEWGSEHLCVYNGGNVGEIGSSPCSLYNY